MNELSGGGGRSGGEGEHHVSPFQGAGQDMVDDYRGLLGVFGIYMYLYGIFVILRDMEILGIYRNFGDYGMLQLMLEY